MTTEPLLPVNLERSLEELERLVDQLEQGELTLEESLQRFARGIELTRTCQATLKLAEQRVEQLLTQNGQAVVVPFELPG